MRSNKVVAGQALPMRIRIGMMVQIASSLVLWSQVAATAPFDLRKRNMATNIKPNTTTPMATQIHSTIMWMSWTSLEVTVTPLGMLSCHGSGLAIAT